MYRARLGLFVLYYYCMHSIFKIFLLLYFVLSYNWWIQILETSEYAKYDNCGGKIMLFLGGAMTPEVFF